MWALVALMGCGGPPGLSLVRPAGTLSGSFHVDVETEEGVELSWWVDDDRPQKIVDGGFDVDTAAWEDGDHVITVRAESWPRPNAEQQFTITSDNSGPRVSIAERSLSVEQGHTLPIVFKVLEPMTSLRVAAFGRERTAFELEPGTWRALVGVPIRQEPGEVAITIETRDDLGNVATYEPKVLVAKVEWETSGKLPLSKKKAEVDPPKVAKMREERDAVYAQITPKQSWEGLFGMPVYKGQHTSKFGTYREYPDGKRSHHDAQDIARRRGVFIYAANSGTVALARSQEVHGNAVLIDHGQKVVSLYSHMQEFLIEEGQIVKRGDKIGRMGSTGRSTGPHLHFGVVVDEVPVDPMQWINEKFDLASFASFEELEPSR